MPSIQDHSDKFIALKKLTYDNRIEQFQTAVTELLADDELDSKGKYEVFMTEVDSDKTVFAMLFATNENAIIKLCIFSVFFLLDDEMIVEVQKLLEVSRVRQRFLKRFILLETKISEHHPEIRILKTNELGRKIYQILSLRLCQLGDIKLFKEHKETVVSYIFSLPEAERLSKINEALTGDSPLQQIFHLRRGRFTPNKNHGTLKVLHQEKNRLEKLVLTDSTATSEMSENSKDSEIYTDSTATSEMSENSKDSEISAESSETSENIDDFSTMDAQKFALCLLQDDNDAALEYLRLTVETDAGRVAGLLTSKELISDFLRRYIRNPYANKSLELMGLIHDILSNQNVCVELKASIKEETSLETLAQTSLESATHFEQCRQLVMLMDFDMIGYLEFLANASCRRFHKEPEMQIRSGLTDLLISVELDPEVIYKIYSVIKQSTLIKTLFSYSDCSTRLLDWLVEFTEKYSLHEKLYINISDFARIYCTILANCPSTDIDIPHYLDKLIGYIQLSHWDKNEAMAIIRALIATMDTNLFEQYRELFSIDNHIATDKGQFLPYNHNSWQDYTGALLSCKENTHYERVYLLPLLAMHDRKHEVRQCLKDIRQIMEVRDDAIFSSDEYSLIVSLEQLISFSKMEYATEILSIAAKLCKADPEPNKVNWFKKLFLKENMKELIMNAQLDDDTAGLLLLQSFDKDIKRIILGADCLGIAILLNDNCSVRLFKSYLRHFYQLKGSGAESDKTAYVRPDTRERLSLHSAIIYLNRHGFLSCYLSFLCHDYPNSIIGIFTDMQFRLLLASNTDSQTELAGLLSKDDLPLRSSTANQILSKFPYNDTKIPDYMIRLVDRLDPSDTSLILYNFVINLDNIKYRALTFEHIQLILDHMKTFDPETELPESSFISHLDRYLYLMLRFDETIHQELAIIRSLHEIFPHIDTEEESKVHLFFRNILRKMHNVRRDKNISEEFVEVYSEVVLRFKNENFVYSFMEYPELSDKTKLIIINQGNYNDRQLDKLVKQRASWANRIINLPDADKAELLSAALDKRTPLGRVFWTKREGIFAKEITINDKLIKTLLAAQNELNKNDPNRFPAATLQELSPHDAPKENYDGITNAHL